MTVLQVVTTLTPGILIEFAMLGLASIGILLKIGANNTATKLLINENSIKLLNLEKELLQLKNDYNNKLHDYDTKLNENKIDLTKALTEFNKNNREDHQMIFNKVETAVTKMTEVATAFKVHADNHAYYRSPRDILNQKEGE